MFVIIIMILRSHNGFDSFYLYMLYDELLQDRVYIEKSRLILSPSIFLEFKFG